jgi:diguanylate cyclase
MFQPAHILVVDDEPILLQSCKLLLEAAGYKVSTATNGKEALDFLVLNHASLSLLLLDLTMPVLDGLGVLRALRERAIEICTVVLSGDIGFDSVSQSFQLGAYDFVKKPYEYEALLKTLHNALERRQMEVNYYQLRLQLERSERLHRYMVESSPDMIFIADKEGNFCFANDRAEAILGYSKDELMGQHYSMLIEPDSINKAAQCFSERRTGDRSTKGEELWLLSKPQSSGSEERKKIAIELNATGVYENETIDETGAKHQRDFSGTYVVARDITERLAAQKLIHYQAYHDLLTGLPNRALFMDRLGNAINSAKRKQDKLAVLFLDLDRFKLINDTLGHDVGDELLKSVATSLKRCLRESDTLARLGGDEFIVLLPDIDNATIAQRVAEKIVKVVKNPFMIGRHEIFVTASVGLAMYPDDGEAADDLIKNSDMAMYHTKASGKDGFRIFTQQLSEQQQAQLSIEQEIRRGIRERQFVVYYQPQIRAKTGEVSGVEALIRWQHPERGLLSPAFFLPIAEESSLILDLGDYVLDMALDDLRSWWKEGFEIKKLAVNFSAHQIDQVNFVDNVISKLKEKGFPGSVLEIEITESTLMNDVDKTIIKLKQLSSFGVHIAIDDFGTGYSSLSLLQKLPINRLKIDRSFIQDLRDDSDRYIIEAIAHMARGLHLEMVAEGVEEDYQLNYLRDLQCQVVQGFLFGQVMSARDFSKFLFGQQAA